jgi:hypothetical protein
MDLQICAPRFVLALSLGVFACNQEALTRDEAVAALEESSLDAQAGALTLAPIEVGTNFTIGSAVEQAASELRAFAAAEIPCARIGVEAGTVTTVWGSSGECTYRGASYSGTSQMIVRRADATTLEVDHTFTDLSNGKVKVSGTAHVTWSGAEHSRHVVHELTWTRLSDGRTGHGTGDRTQTLVDPAVGLAAGVRIDGNRHWSGAGGEWDLAITGVQARPSDPVPEAGAYQLTTPGNKSISLSFARRTDDVIRVTLSGPKREFSFDVRQLGTISDS